MNLSTRTGDFVYDFDHLGTDEAYVLIVAKASGPHDPLDINCLKGIDSLSPVKLQHNNRVSTFRIPSTVMPWMIADVMEENGVQHYRLGGDSGRVATDRPSKNVLYYQLDSEEMEGADLEFEIDDSTYVVAADVAVHLDLEEVLPDIHQKLIESGRKVAANVYQIDDPNIFDTIGAEEYDYLFEILV